MNVNYLLGREETQRLDLPSSPHRAISSSKKLTRPSKLFTIFHVPPFEAPKTKEWCWKVSNVDEGCWFESRRGAEYFLTGGVFRRSFG